MCALWSVGRIGTYFLDTACGEAVTVKGVCYRQLFTELLWSEVNKNK